LNFDLEKPGWRQSEPARGSRIDIGGGAISNYELVIAGSYPEDSTGKAPPWPWVRRVRRRRPGSPRS
jgi:hypothetical protein